MKKEEEEAHQALADAEREEAEALEAIADAEREEEEARVAEQNAQIEVRPRPVLLAPVFLARRGLARCAFFMSKCLGVGG